MRLYSRYITAIPECMACLQPPASEDELEVAHRVRSQFLLPGWPTPYLNNVVRILRLFEGAGSYLEVNSRDKGFMAQVAGRLAPDATLVDVDLMRYPDNERLLRDSLAPTQKLVRVEVDPEGEKAPAALLSQVGGQGFDVVMVCTGNTMNRVLSDFSVYFEFVRPGGMLVMNDVCWEGDHERRGNFHALSLVNAQLPVYCVHMDEPVHRLAPREVIGGEWGTLGVIQKPLV
jgi:hypothetical protein